MCSICCLNVLCKMELLVEIFHFRYLLLLEFRFFELSIICLRLDTLRLIVFEVLLDEVQVIKFPN